MNLTPPDLRDAYRDDPHPAGGHPVAVLGGIAAGGSVAMIGPFVGLSLTVTTEAAFSFGVIETAAILALKR